MAFERNRYREFLLAGEDGGTCIVNLDQVTGFIPQFNDSGLWTGTLARLSCGDAVLLNASLEQIEDALDTVYHPGSRKVYHIVKGEVTSLDAYENQPDVKLGQTEWQFSDGPAGARGSSADYLSLEDGLKDHAPAIFIWEG